MRMYGAGLIRTLGPHDRLQTQVKFTAAERKRSAPILSNSTLCMVLNGPAVLVMQTQRFTCVGVLNPTLPLGCYSY